MEGDELRRILELPELPKSEQPIAEGKPELRNTAAE
jgi:hypothetical protein